MSQVALKIVGLFLMGIVPILFSCSEEKGPVEAEIPFAIQRVEVPALMNGFSSQPLLLTARVTHPRGNEGIDSVRLSLQNNQQETVVGWRLWDDGGQIDPRSGDVIAFDQVYSRRIVPAMDLKDRLSPGMYRVIVEAFSTEGESVRVDTLQTEYLLNHPPQLLEVVFPDSILPGMPPTTIQFAVQDSDGVADVQGVLIVGQREGDASIAFRDTVWGPPNPQGVLSEVIDSTYGAGKNGPYQLTFSAFDRVEDYSPPREQTIAVQNTPPEIWNAVAPDTIKIPASGSQKIVITVQVTDAQGLADVDSVFFNSYLPDGQPSQGNPFLMFDNGLPYEVNDPQAAGDELAGDGIYTLTIFLAAGTPPGDYRFAFWAVDRVGHRTAGPVRVLHLIQ